mmetsp:Transcript_25301/g.58758  ORF Transcript_25301/g.58758 Transcript_25301/m.58758 type:complete len:234 (+) Transcript_25301:624-1325(+)
MCTTAIRRQCERFCWFPTMIGVAKDALAVTLALAFCIVFLSPETLLEELWCKELRQPLEERHQQHRQGAGTCPVVCNQTTHLPTHLDTRPQLLEVLHLRLHLPQVFRQCRQHLGAPQLQPAHPLSGPVACGPLLHLLLLQQQTLPLPVPLLPPQPPHPAQHQQLLPSQRQQRRRMRLLCQGLVPVALMSRCLLAVAMLVKRSSKFSWNTCSGRTCRPQQQQMLMQGVLLLQRA